MTIDIKVKCQQQRPPCSFGSTAFVFYNEIGFEAYCFVLSVGELPAAVPALIAWEASFFLFAAAVTRVSSNYLKS